MIPKKLHYIWFWKWEKPKNFSYFLNSWEKYCPDYEIIEWNEDNYDIKKNPYLYKYYTNKDFAFASDYARFDILYKEWGIYLDIDVEIFKNFDNLLNQEWFTAFQDIFFIGGCVIWAQKWNTVIKSVLDFYEQRQKKIIITHSFWKVLKDYWLKRYNGKNQYLKNFTVYTKDYFYPFAFFETIASMKKTKNTYAVHHFNASWLPKIIQIPTSILFRFLSFVYGFVIK